MLWGIRPVVTQAAYGIAVDRLRRQIHCGLLLPDEKLPAERQLSEDIGISRVTLREALRVLETDSYIVVRRGAHGGAFVADVDSLQQIAIKRSGKDRAENMRILEFRQANEIAAVQLACARRQPPEIKRLESALESLRRAESAPQLKQADTLFRLAMAEASHNTFLNKAIESGISEMFRPYQFQHFASVMKNCLLVHEKLHVALVQRDPETASESLSKLLELERSLLRRLPDAT